jgi:F-box/leucine-rich repeat protein 2/20
MSNTQVTDSGIKALVARCPSLIEISIESCDRVSQDIATIIAESCPGLQRVNFNELYVRMSNESLEALGGLPRPLPWRWAGCPDLYHVSLSGANVDDNGVTALSLGCPRLAHVDLSKTKVTDSGLMDLANNCKGLIDINLAECNTLQGHAPQTASTTTEGDLTTSFFSFNLSGGIVSTAGKTQAEVDTELKVMNDADKVKAEAVKNGCDDTITDEGITHLAITCPGLTHINLSNTLVTDIAVTALATNCPGLKDVNLGSCNGKKGFANHNGGVTDVGIAALADNCPNLVHIALSSTVVTDVGIVALASKCHRITHWEVACMEHEAPDDRKEGEGFTDIGLKAIGKYV